MIKKDRNITNQSVSFFVNSKSKKRANHYMENGLKRGPLWFPLLLVIPALINFLVFWLYPNFDSILLSFQNQFGEFTLGNYEWVLAQTFASADGVFAIALKNTLSYWALGYFVVQTANIVGAYFIYKKIALSKFFRFVLYLPNMISGIVLVSVYKEVIGPEGPLMELLLSLKIIDKPLMLLNNVHTAMTWSLVFSLWSGFGSVFLWCSGAMARIPKEVLEAASLDGVTPWTEFTRIILPMISGTLATLYVVGVSGIFAAGGATMFLTFGAYNTDTLSFWIIKSVYTGGGSGTPSALGIMMAVFTMPIILIVKYVSGKLTSEVSY